MHRCRNNSNTLPFSLAIDFAGTWDDFFAHVRAGKQLHGDQVDWIMSWLNNRHYANILVVMYEDMVDDLSREMQKIVKFLKIEITADHFEKVLKSATLEYMRQDSATNYTLMNKLFDQSTFKFIRSGKIGQWKNHFTVAQNEWFDDKYKDRLEASGVKLRYE
jgi:hypothetical protein